MLTRSQMLVELESLKKREAQLAAELNQIIGARQFCEFALQDGEEEPALSFGELKEGLESAGLQVGEIEPIAQGGNHASSESAG